MNERIFSSEFMRKWKKETKSKLWFHKIADPTVQGAPTGKRAVDYIGCLNGRMIGIEWKYIINDRMPLSRVRPNQIKTLEEIQAVGGSAFIFIGRLCVNEKLVFMIPIDVWRKMLLYERLSCVLSSSFPKFLYHIPKYQKPYRDFLEKMERLICENPNP